MFDKLTVAEKREIDSCCSPFTAEEALKKFYEQLSNLVFAIEVKNGLDAQYKYLEKSDKNPFLIFVANSVSQQNQIVELAKESLRQAVEIYFIGERFKFEDEVL